MWPVAPADHCETGMQQGTAATVVHNMHDCPQWEWKELKKDKRITITFKTCFWTGQNGKTHCRKVRPNPLNFQTLLKALCMRHVPTALAIRPSDAKCQMSVRLEAIVWRQSGFSSQEDIFNLRERGGTKLLNTTRRETCRVHLTVLMMMANVGLSANVSRQPSYKQLLTPPGHTFIHLVWSRGTTARQHLTRSAIGRQVGIVIGGELSALYIKVKHLEPDHEHFRLCVCTRAISNLPNIHRI